MLIWRFTYCGLPRLSRIPRNFFTSPPPPKKIVNIFFRFSFTHAKSGGGAQLVVLVPALQQLDSISILVFCTSFHFLWICKPGELLQYVLQPGAALSHTPLMVDYVFRAVRVCEGDTRGVERVPGSYWPLPQPGQNSAQVRENHQKPHQQSTFS